ncbi:MAG: hypothetical protein L6V91_09130 [Bacilli bacterium]|nr:MAG: hypothetical protein L6V91_09130 [Bacilli bacterium]
MITKSCPIKELKKYVLVKKEDIYYLEDINKNRYRVLHNNCLTHIMHYKKRLIILIILVIIKKS